MKKRWLAVAMTAGLLALVGCGSGTSEPLGLDPMKRFREGYEETVAATTVTQTIEVVRGKLAVYEYEKAYERTDDGYAVTATEKRLNKIDADTEEAYTVVEQEGTAQAASTFTGGLKLNRLSFKPGYSLTQETFHGEIRDGMENTVLGLSRDHAAMDEVVLTMTLGETGLTGLTVDFRSGEYTVSIVITYVYAN